VKKLKERGLVSPYLSSFVVARINPLRWIKGKLQPSFQIQHHRGAFLMPPLEEVLKTMRERAAKFNRG
jgi:ParB family transcriptional regulator, chromosome partitioning protein